MNPYHPYMEHAREYGHDPDEYYKTPYEAAMYSHFDENERRFLADWAVRRNISVDDPVWHLLELAMLTNRWAQESIGVMQEETKESTVQLQSITENLGARLRRDSLSLSQDMQQQLADELKDTGAQLKEEIISATGRNVANEVRRILRLWVPGIVISVLLVVLMLGGSLFILHTRTVQLSESQQVLLNFGQRVKDQYYDLPANQQAEMDKLMGWNQSNQRQ